MTRRTHIAVIIVLLAFCASWLGAQSDSLQPMRIAAIKASPATYLNERVRIDGFVTQFVDAGSKSTSFFYLKDDWGAVMKVRTSKEAPSVGKRYSIEGPVGLDPRSKDLYVSEESRLELFKPVEPTVTLNQQKMPSPPTTASGSDVSTDSATAGQVSPSNATQSAAGGSPTTTSTPPIKAADSGGGWLPIYLAIGGAVVLILAAAIFLMLRSRREETPTAEYGIPAASYVEPPPPPEQVIEGKTIKLHAPPPNTVKLLPGWFEVTAGDDVVKQIRFYKLSGDRGSETTFGRATGRPYAHIQLKAPTVSSRQAKISFDNGAAKLTNFASAESNPTKVNGRELDVNESVDLSESDHVEMGEVSLLFHSAPSLTRTAAV